MSLAGYAAGVEGMELHTQIRGNPERNTACRHQGLRGNTTGLEITGKGVECLKLVQDRGRRWDRARHGTEFSRSISGDVFLY